MYKATYLALFLLSVSFGCKKDGAKTTCRVVAVTIVPKGGNPEAVSFTYDEEGRIKFMATGDQNIEFWYYPNGVRRKINQNSGWFTFSTFELNSSGKPVTRKDSVYQGQSLNSTRLITFEYDGQGQLIKTFKDNDPNPVEILTWSGGNLVKLQSGSVSYILDYYTDKTNRDYGLIDLQMFLNLGVNLARSKNQLRAMASGGDQLIFDYEYDGSGNIKKWYATLLGNPDTLITSTQSLECN